MIGMSLFWILPLALLAWAFLAFSRRTPTHSGNRREGSETPREVLQRRYARGEIDSDEYEDRLRRLT
jgi:putative membrane protein